MWFLFLITIFLNGFILSNILFKRCLPILTLISSFIFGSMLSVSYIYFFNSYLFRNLSLTMITFFIWSAVLILLNRCRLKSGFGVLFSSLKKIELIFILLTLIFSYYLMVKTFSYDANKSHFLIASHVYSDFGDHLPIIRSFSLGNNFPFEVPFFAGSGLQYHFMFDLFAGILEHLGLRIDYALNIISAVSFACLLIMIFILGWRLFNSRMVGILAVILFLFPSNLSFIEFIKKYGLRFSAIFYFWHNTEYFVNSSLGINTVSTFISLNNFLNQRQLIFGLLFALFIGYMFLDYFSKKGNLKQLLFTGFLLGLLPFWHAVIFGVIVCWLLTLVLAYPSLRKKIVFSLMVSALVALPQIVIISRNVARLVTFSPGFLINQHLTAGNFLTFWILNLGLVIPLIITSFFLSHWQQRKLFLTTLPLFIIPNLFKFSMEIFDNHKFFSLWIIIVNLFIAWVIVFLWRRQMLMKILAVILVFFLTLSGLLNFLVAKNDVFARITDYPANVFMSWVNGNIPEKEIILTNGEIYDPATLVGRKIFLGRGHHIFTYGGINLNERIIVQNEILEGNSLPEVRQKLEHYRIRYLVLYKNDFAKNIKKTSYQFFKDNFIIEYEDRDGLVVKR